MVFLELSNGLRVQVTAKAIGHGINVHLTTELNDVTRAFDEEFAIKLARYEAASAAGTHHGMSFPLTGAEALLMEVELRDVGGHLPPHSVIRWSGGSQTPWSVSWKSRDWQPRTVVLTGLGLEKVPIEVANA